MANALATAEYEVALAERRYEEVDPSNRLVASTLERRWNDALLQLQDLKKQAAESQQQQARVMTRSRRRKYWLWLETCRASGMHPARKLRIESGCCGC